MPCLGTQTLLDCLSLEPKPPTHTCRNRHAEIDISLCKTHTHTHIQAPTLWHSHSFCFQTEQLQIRQIGTKSTYVNLWNKDQSSNFISVCFKRMTCESHVSKVLRSIILPSEANTPPHRHFTPPYLRYLSLTSMSDKTISLVLYFHLSILWSWCWQHVVLYFHYSAIHCAHASMHYRTPKLSFQGQFLLARNSSVTYE